MDRRTLILLLGSDVSGGTPASHPAIPAAPSGLTATTNGSSQIDLSWTDNSSDETAFAIFKSTDGVSFSEIGTAAADATTYSATGLSSSTLYYFYVKARNASGDSTASGQASATTDAAVLPTSGLVLHLDASLGAYTDAARTSAATLDGDVVQGWADNSASANHASQSTTAQAPLLKTNVINGLPVIRFDGSDDWLSIANSASLKPGSGDWSVAVVLKRNSAVGDYQNVIGSRPFNSGTDLGWGVMYSGNTGKMASHYGDGGSGHDVSTEPDGQSSTVLSNTAFTAWLIEEDRTNSHLNFYLNGALDVQRSPSEPGAISQNDACTIGGTSPTERHFQVDIAFIAVWNRTLDSTERTAVNNYMLSTFGLP